MTVQRQPAIRSQHPAEDLPERPAKADSPSRTPAAAKAAPSRPSPAGEEKLTAQHNVRIRPSTKERLGEAVDKLRYETKDRTISIASITDAAINDYLTKKGC